MIWGLLILLAVSFGQRISRAEELPVKIGGGSGEEVELAGVSGGILTVETRHPGDQMFVRQMSNGQDLLILVYTSNGQLVECEKFQGPTPELNRFMNQHSNLISAVQQGQNGTTFKDTEKMEFNGTPMDWNRSWKDCIRLQEAQREEITRIRRSRSVAVRSPRSRRWTPIYPGTKWCGKGNSWREGEPIYGRQEATDRCCHQHDFCPQSIGPGETKYNYHNYRWTTISHCDCDNKFRRCLRDAQDSVSNMVGRLYFNILRLKCFTLQNTVQIHDATPY